LINGGAPAISGWLATPRRQRHDEMLMTDDRSLKSVHPQNASFMQLPDPGHRLTRMLP